ncbi:MAG: DUF1460 domain-containing protein [Myxococcales bacterium]|nr:DUF1460 domain-containing protein [Myxococcales bacterium]
MTFVVMALVAVAPWQSLDGGARAAQIEALKSLPLEARFAAASEGFLGTPYLLSPLGEGAGHDPDPLLRYDAADCLTMVEQSLALAVTPDESQVIETLNHIRYEGAPSYEGRLHVMEAQWLPVNLSRGLLEDVTRRYGKDVVKRVSKRITKETWAEKGGVSLGLSPEGQATGEFYLDVVPSDRAPAVLATAPEGLIVVVVRADRPRLVTRVTHVAVLVQKPSGPFLRHASRSFKKVVDEPVEKYLKRNLEFGAWTVEGVALYRVSVPAWLDAGVAIDAGVAGTKQPPVPIDAGVTAPAPPVVVEERLCRCSSTGGGAVLLLVLLAALRSGRRRLG